MNLHKLKCWQVYFDALEQGIKTFEYRKNDRNPKFQVGDLLLIQEYEPEELGGPEGTQILKSARYTGKELQFVITYILQGVMNLPDGYCILGIQRSQSQIEKDQYDYRFDHRFDTIEDDLRS